MPPLTHEQRQELIHRPYPIRTLCPDYRWGGVQVIDKFMRESVEDILDDLTPGTRYDGLYSTSVDDALAEMEELVTPAEFEEFLTIAERGIE